MKKTLLVLLLLSSIKQSSAQFSGQSGVYYLGSGDTPIAASEYSNPDISGVVCRFRWETLEPSPNNFNWTFIDGEILKAQNANKKISLQPVGGRPTWLIDSLHAQGYYYIDKNPIHPTFGQIVSGVLPWDSIYISRLKILYQNLAAKYANDTTVSYFNLIASQMSRNLPDTILTDTTLLIQQPFWTAFNYNADTLAVLMDTMIDYYMNLFPSTPLWCSVDYVRFEIHASGHPINYLASLYTNYGITNYPDRFGLWREDLSGCNPQPIVMSGSQWYIMNQNPCRTGAQMIMSVQDGPVIMNKCNMIPNTKSFVLDSAVQHGITLGMRYMEIYGGDIDDTSLASNIATANTNLILKGNLCNGITAISELNELSNTIFIYPNPANTEININLPSNNNFEIEIINTLGESILNTQNKHTIDVSQFSNGIYFIKVKQEDNFYSQRFIKQ